MLERFWCFRGFLAILWNALHSVCAQRWNAGYLLPRSNDSLSDRKICLAKAVGRCIMRTWLHHSEFYSSFLVFPSPHDCSTLDNFPHLSIQTCAQRLTPLNTISVDRQFLHSTRLPMQNQFWSQAFTKTVPSRSFSLKTSDSDSVQSCELWNWKTSLFVYLLLFTFLSLFIGTIHFHHSRTPSRLFSTQSFLADVKQSHKNTHFALALEPLNLID